MPLITESHDSLPYIDSEPTPAERAAAQQLISAEMASDTSTHPSLPAMPSVTPTAAMAAEYARLACSQPFSGGIDTARYEALEAPGSEDASAWKAALQQAYVSHTYLCGRQTHLSLLEQFGKNAWLISNAQLEAELAALEREFAATKEAIDFVAVERKKAQEGAAGEMKGLEETWKRGVGRVLETEIAAEGVRREILDLRRAGV